MYIISGDTALLLQKLLLKIARGYGGDQEQSSCSLGQCGLSKQGTEGPAQSGGSAQPCAALEGGSSQTGHQLGLDSLKETVFN